MSKITSYGSGVVPPPPGSLSNLEGDTGGPVFPNSGATIDILGDGIVTYVVGYPLSNELVISAPGAANQFVTDSGTAVVSDYLIGIEGDSNITTEGSSGVVQITLNPNVTLPGYLQAGGDIHTTGGDVVISDGDLDLPFTASPTVGVINMGGIPWLHAYHGSSPNGGNLFMGISEGQSAGNFTLTTASQNVGLGGQSLFRLTTGVNNIAVGYYSGQSITSGRGNSCIGTIAAGELTTGSYNSLLGDNVAFSLVSGSGNTALGTETLGQLTTGSYNLAISGMDGSDPTKSAGYEYTGAESSNIVIGNIGVTGESNVIRIGTQGSGVLQQASCWIAGIYNTPIGATNHIVSVDSTGQLGLTSGPESFTWTNITSGSQTLAPNNGYVADFGTLITFTLPTVAAFGTLISVVGLGAGGWIIAQNAGQNIQFGNLSTTHGASGSLASTNQYDQVDLLCIVANLTWTIRGPISNLTIV